MHQPGFRLGRIQRSLGEKDVSAKVALNQFEFLPRGHAELDDVLEKISKMSPQSLPQAAGLDASAGVARDRQEALAALDAVHAMGLGEQHRATKIATELE